MNPAKIRLSATEMELVENTGWILTKNRILEKVKSLLAQLHAEQVKLTNTRFSYLPQEIIAIPGKISKGENYRGLPYLVLDYPRYFNKEDMCAIRTMFWWGHFFSCTLVLSGRYKKQWEASIIQNVGRINRQDFYVCTGPELWEHHFEKENYTPLRDMDHAALGEHIRSSSFLKIAQPISLQQWDIVEEKLIDLFHVYMEMLESVAAE